VTKGRAYDQANCCNRDGSRWNDRLQVFANTQGQRTTPASGDPRSSLGCIVDLAAPERPSQPLPEYRTDKWDNGTTLSHYLYRDPGNLTMVTDYGLN